MSDMEAELAAFEAKFQRPSDCDWISQSARFCATSYHAWDAHKHIERWEGWKARALVSGGAHPFQPPTYTDPTCREAQMVVIERDASGKPTVWCDPEIADLIRALNTGGVRTIASCSGHGEKPGWIALKDGRQLAIVADLDSFKRLIGAGTNGVPAGSDAGIPASPVGVDLPVPPSCAWQEDDPNGNMAGTYASACGELWSFTEGGVAENNVRFCHGCGKPVNVIPFPQPPEEAAEDGVTPSDSEGVCTGKSS